MILVTELPSWQRLFDALKFWEGARHIQLIELSEQMTTAAGAVRALGISLEEATVSAREFRALLHEQEPVHLKPSGKPAYCALHKGRWAQ